MKRLLTKKKVSVVLGAAAGILLLGGISFLPTPNDASAAENALVGIVDTYYVDDIISMPTQLSTANGVVDADVKVIHPDGTELTGDSVAFTSPGIYTFEYSANGGAITDTTEVTVAYPLYELNLDYATAEYSAQGPFGTEKAYPGILVSLPENGVFSYNRVVDLSDKTKDDLIYSGNIVANETGMNDFFQLNVRFTDIYNPKNYVTVELWRNGTADGVVYCRAGAYNQKTAGWDHRQQRPREGKYGKWVRCSFQNTPNSGKRETDVFNVYFDYAEKAIYTDSAWVDPVYGNMIIDLDNPAHFGTLWEGFETGECYMSVFATSYNGASGNVYIQSIGGDSGDDLSGKLLVDKDAPVLTADYGEYEESNLPVAYKGIAYPIFDVTSFDSYTGTTPVVAEAYLDYGKATQSKVEVVDGKFTPTKAGTYTIVYTSSDYYRNEGVKEVTVECIELPSAMKANFVGDKATSAKTGYDLRLSDYEIENASGEPNVKIDVKFGGETVATVDVNERIYRPMQAGEYEFVYSATDYVDQRDSVSYKVTIENDSAPVYLEHVVLPRYLIATYQYALPALSATDFSDGEKAVASELWIQEEGSEAYKLTGNTFTPTANAAGKNVTVIYKAIGKNGTQTDVYTIPCYGIYQADSATKLELNKLFVHGDDVTSAWETFNNKEYAAYKASADASINYINPLPAQDVVVNFGIYGAKTNYGKLTFVLTDYLDESVSIKFSYIVAADGSISVSVNDGVAYPLSVYNFKEESLAVALEYVDSKNTFYTNNGNSAYAVDKTIAGEAFSGFPSGRAYLTISMEGVSEESEIIVQKVCNQQLNTASRDISDPMLSVIGEYSQTYSRGQILTLYKAVCLDLINPDVTSALSVYDPDGNPVKTVDGVTLEGVEIFAEYSISLDKYGKYKIYYTVGEDLDYYFYIEVIDETAPVITVSTTIKQTYKVGQTISVSAKATDEVDGECAVYFTMEDSVDVVDMFEKSYTFYKAGKYKLLISSWDTKGNYSVLIYEIEVK